MKKIFLVLLLILLSFLPAYADLIYEYEVQTQINQIGTNILNSNKIQKHIIFTYNKKTRANALKIVRGLKKNQIILYEGIYQYAETDDEVAAILARKIYLVNKISGNLRNKINITKEPKFYEMIIDKKAVDYMVNAGYNPLALITYLNKTTPDYRFSIRHNVTSKRLIAIYEYILAKYPQYLNEENSYSDDPYFQNFLLNTVFERDKQDIKNYDEYEYE